MSGCAHRPSAPTPSGPRPFNAAEALAPLPTRLSERDTGRLEPALLSAQPSVLMSMLYIWFQVCVVHTHVCLCVHVCLCICMWADTCVPACVHVQACVHGVRGQWDREGTQYRASCACIHSSVTQDPARAWLEASALRHGSIKEDSALCTFLRGPCRFCEEQPRDDSLEHANYWWGDFVPSMLFHSSLWICQTVPCRFFSRKQRQGIRSLFF